MAAIRIAASTKRTTRGESVCAQSVVAASVAIIITDCVPVVFRRTEVGVAEEAEAEAVVEGVAG